jgi:hypothetical protein
MFETNLDTLGGRRAGRIAFGTVLIAGALAILVRPHLPFYISAAELMVGSWVCAFAAALALGQVPVRESGYMFKTSIVVPSIGIALMLPLLLHLPVVAAAAGTRSFDAWVDLSIIFVGPAHLAFALMAALRGARLTDGKPAQSVNSLYVWVLIVSCIPFVLFLIPPLLVGLTGAFILPVLFYQSRLVEQERHSMTNHLPRAIAWVA